MVFALDALHTEHCTARLLHDAGAAYVMTINGTQPSMLAAVQDRLPAPQPTASRQHARGHG